MFYTAVRVGLRRVQLIGLLIALSEIPTAAFGAANVARLVVLAAALRVARRRRRQSRSAEFAQCGWMGWHVHLS
jgi:hypothetical protein